MLSRFVNSARNILPLRIPRLQEESKAEDITTEPAMVTTRRQSGIKAAHADETSPPREDDVSETVLESSRKRRRIVKEDDVEEVTGEESTTDTRKTAKEMPMEEKDEEHYEKHTHFAVEIPVSDILVQGTIPLDLEENSASESANKLENTTAVEKTVEAGNTSSQAVPEALGDDVARPASSNANSSKSGRRQNPNSKAKLKSTLPLEPTPIAKTAPSAKSKHKRFGSEEPEITELEPLKEKRGEIEDSGDGTESSDDDAPEIVATHQALEEARASARNTAKVSEQQEALTRKKHKARDVQLKQQAQAASKKRKRGGKRDGSISPAADESNEEKETKDPLGVTPICQTNRSTKPLATSSKTKISRFNLPDLLPEEYLQDDDDTPIQSLQSSVTNPKMQKPKKTKFMDPKPKRPKDRVKGSTTFHVLEGRGEGLLAPKASIDARVIKEAWLTGKRNVHGTGGTTRKVVGASFFRR